MPGPRDRRWLRPLGLFAIAMVLSVGQPSLVAAVAFAFVTLLAPGGGVFPILAAAAALGLSFMGEPTGAFWYLERGWAVLVGGWFAIATALFPASSFLSLGLVAVGCAAVSTGLLFSGMGGVEAAEWFVAERIGIMMSASLRALESVSNGSDTTALTELMGGMAEALRALFPAMVALSSLAALGVGWWMHRRIATGLRDGLGGIRDFRFPDPLIWLLIIGIALMIAAEWNVGWGRAGANLVAFMGGLYIFRGFGVLLFLTGGLSWLGGLALLAGLVLASPFLLTAAMVVGVGDSWFDFRSRAGGGGDGGSG